MSSDTNKIYPNRQHPDLLSEWEFNHDLFVELYSSFIEDTKQELISQNLEGKFLNEIQLEGIRFLCFSGSGCKVLTGQAPSGEATYFISNMALNGDTMGTGKTLQLMVTGQFLTLFYRTKYQRRGIVANIRTLILAPKFLIHKWRDEYIRFFPLIGNVVLVEDEEGFVKFCQSASDYCEVAILSSSMLEIIGFVDEFVALSQIHSINWILEIDEIHAYHPLRRRKLYEIWPLRK